MSVWTYEEYRVRQQEIEVKALIALMKHARVFEVKQDAEIKLWKLAFPDEVAKNLKRIEQEKLDLEDLK